MFITLFTLLLLSWLQHSTARGSDGSIVFRIITKFFFGGSGKELFASILDHHQNLTTSDLGQV